MSHRYRVYITAHIVRILQYSFRPLLKAMHSLDAIHNNKVSGQTLPSQRFAGKVAVVTASSDGIGLAIVQRPAEGRWLHRRNWYQVSRGNGKASFLLAQEAKPLILQRGGGSIVFISSISGFGNTNVLEAYAVSKTALLGLTKATALKLGPQNIRVNYVAPGPIKTAFAQSCMCAGTAMLIEFAFISASANLPTQFELATDEP